MENRRSSFRMDFPPAERLRIRIEIPGRRGPIVTGQVINLSLGGMSVQLCDRSLRFQLGDRFLAQFWLPGGPDKLVFHCSVVRIASVDDPIYGIRFLPLAETGAESARERVLGKFLLDEQQRLRQQIRDEAHAPFIPGPGPRSSEPPA